MNTGCSAVRELWQQNTIPSPRLHILILGPLLVITCVQQNLTCVPTFSCVFRVADGTHSKVYLVIDQSRTETEHLSFMTMHQPLCSSDAVFVPACLEYDARLQRSQASAASVKIVPCRPSHVTRWSTQFERAFPGGVRISWRTTYPHSLESEDACINQIGIQILQSA